MTMRESLPACSPELRRTLPGGEACLASKMDGSFFRS